MCVHGRIDVYAYLNKYFNTHTHTQTHPCIHTHDYMPDMQCGAAHTGTEASYIRTRAVSQTRTKTQHIPGAILAKNLCHAGKGHEDI